MTVKQLIEFADRENLLSDKLAGRTPGQTMKSKLCQHIRKLADNSLFVRTAPGRFYLRELVDSRFKVYSAKPLEAPPPAERVLVFPSNWLDTVGRFQGIRRTSKRVAQRFLRSPNIHYLDRIEAEQSESLKQVLTYVLVTRKTQILAYKRGTYNRVETYLRGSQCVGFGGHVTELDATLFNVQSDHGVIDNARRELMEELNLPDRDKHRLQRGEGLRIVGLINDDSSPTGRRHFAVVLQFEVVDKAWSKPIRGEKAITQLRWLDLGSSEFDISHFEYWSQLCLRSFFRRLLRTQPTYRIQRTRPLIPPHILCILGEIGSGKSVATNILREEYGYTEVNSGRVLAELLGIPPVPLTSRDEFQFAAFDFIVSPEGPTRLARKLYDAIQRVGSDRLLVDGIRQRATLRELKRLSGQTKVGVAFIHTVPDIAYTFYKERTNKNITIQDFLKIRESPVERETHGLIELADAVVYNWTGRILYDETIRSMMRHLGIRTVGQS